MLPEQQVQPAGVSLGMHVALHTVWAAHRPVHYIHRMLTWFSSTRGPPLLSIWYTALLYDREKRDA